jgi:hypothetical protein
MLLPPPRPVWLQAAAAISQTVASGGRGQPSEEDMNAAAERIRRLPAPQVTLLAFLLHHLGHVASAADRNKMTSANIAIVFRCARG